MASGIRAGHPTFWQSFGNGPRRVLAIHCTLAHSGVWAGMAAHLPDTTLTGFDAPGHGRSGDWADDGAPGGYQRLTADIAASFLAEADAPIDIVGHSFGATVALRLAIDAPSAVRSLTLIEPVLFAAVEGSAAFDYELGRADQLAGLVAEGRLEAAADYFTRIWGSGQPWESLPASARARFAAQVPMVVALNRINAEDPAGLLRPGALEALEAPVLLVEGARSPAITHEIHRAIAPRMADARIARMEGAGHMLPLTHPAETAALVRENLARA